MSASSKRRWCQISLRTLFVLMTVIVVATVCGNRYWTWFRAVRICERVDAAFDAEQATWDQLGEASLRRLRAELQLPFANPDSARQRHRRCMEKIIAAVLAEHAASGARTGEWISPETVRESLTHAGT